MNSQPEVAYYYPQPFWLTPEADDLKSLLLFFDRIAILLPRYMRGRERSADPVLAGPLRDHGLLDLLEPETFVDQNMGAALAADVERLIDAGAFDELDRRVYFQELSRSRMGWGADVGLAKDLIRKLKKRGLAKKSEDGVSVPLHPVVRTVILVLLSQLARKRGHQLGLDLHPVTSDHRAAHGVLRTLSLPSTPSAGHIVAFDLETMGVDLSSVPLDEILSFRSQHGTEFRAYATELRRLVALLGPLPEEERARLLADRREEMVDRAEDLRRRLTQAWTHIQPVGSIGLGVVGAAWLSEGDLPAAVYAFATGIVGAAIPQPEIGAYSYMYNLRNSIGTPGHLQREYTGF